MWIVSHKEQANAKFPLVVFPCGSFSKCLPRGGQPVPAAGACLGPCSVAPKTASLQGSKEGTESREPPDDGCSHPHASRLQLWAGNQGSNLVPVHFCKTRLCSHPPSTATAAWFEACSAPTSTRGSPAASGNLPPSENTSRKILFAMNKAEQSCRVTPSPAKHALYKSRFWNRKRLIIIL